MAMFECPGCKRIVDDSVKKCPSCSYDIRKYVKAQKKDAKKGGKNGQEIASFSLSSVYSSNKSEEALPTLDFLKPEPVFDSPELKKAQEAIQEEVAVTAPEIKTPEIKVPEVKTPEVKAPEPSILDEPKATPESFDTFDAGIARNNLSNPAAVAASIPAPTPVSAPTVEKPAIEEPTIEEPVAAPAVAEIPAPAPAEAAKTESIFKPMAAPAFKPSIPGAPIDEVKTEPASIFDKKDDDKAYHYGPINPPSNGRPPEGTIQIPAPSMAAPERTPIKPNAPVVPPTPVYDDPQEQKVETYVFETPSLNKPKAPAAPVFDSSSLNQPAQPAAPMFDSPSLNQPAQPAAPMFDSPSLNQPAQPAAPMFDSPSLNQPAQPAAPVFDSPSLNAGPTNTAMPASAASLASISKPATAQSTMGNFGMSTAATQSRVPANTQPKKEETASSGLLFDSPELNARAAEIASGAYVPTSKASDATLADANKPKLPTGNISHSTFGQAQQSSYKSQGLQGGYYGSTPQAPKIADLSVQPGGNGPAPLQLVPQQPGQPGPGYTSAASSAVNSANPLLGGGARPTAPPPNPIAMNVNMQPQAPQGAMYGGQAPANPQSPYGGMRPQGSLYGTAQPQAPQSPYGNPQTTQFGVQGGNPLNVGNPLLGGGASALNAGNPLLGGGQRQ